MFSGFRSLRQSAQQYLRRVNTERQKHTEKQRDAYAYTPVNNVERVQISQRAGHLGDVEFSPRLGKSALLLEVEEELERKRTTP